MLNPDWGEEDESIHQVCIKLTKSVNKVSNKGTFYSSKNPGKKIDEK